MTTLGMTSMQRVLTTLGHKEPDRVPLFLLVTMHGARELGLSIKDYFAQSETVVEGQFRMRAKYGNDCLYGFFYAPAEVEAWGAEVIYVEDGPPNSGRPFIRQPEDIERLEPPRVEECPCLIKILRAIEMMKARAGDEVPIIGVALSPFSLPVMQLGFDRYLELMHERPVLFERLMRINEEFCVAWANAQLRAGATIITYYDPVSSSTIVPRAHYLQNGFRIAQRTLARIKGPTATHFAAGRCLPILDDVAKLGTMAVGVSVDEDIEQLKAIARGRITLLGNLNGIAMRGWTPVEAEDLVKEAIRKAGPGGGFILSDNHGEIPWQVPEDVLMTISEAVHRWGRYPLDWIDRHES